MLDVFKLLGGYRTAHVHQRLSIFSSVRDGMRSTHVPLREREGVSPLRRFLPRDGLLPSDGSSMLVTPTIYWPLLLDLQDFSSGRLTSCRCVRVERGDSEDAPLLSLPGRIVPEWLREKTKDARPSAHDIIFESTASA